MARRQVLVQLNDDLLTRLDARACREARSRSELVRSAIETYLADDINSAIDAAIVDGYTRIPPDDNDPMADRMAIESIESEPW